ncbi:MAG: aspartyl protease family protein [Turicibacter sp.]|nr:aspartyl protease family protein [Turicibacter sp.]
MDLFFTSPVKESKTFIVRCRVYSPNPTNKHWDKIDKGYFNFLIDTGASISGLSRVYLQKLGYTKFKTGNPPKQTAMGLKSFDSCVMSRIAVGREYPFNTREIDVFDDIGKRYDGVLGVDILSKLHFHSDKEVFTLQDKPIEFTKIKELEEKIQKLEEKIRKLEMEDVLKPSSVFDQTQK